MLLRRFARLAATVGAAMLCVSPAFAVPRTYTVVIDKMKFGPVPAVLHKGDAILWVNKDFLRHSATAKDHSFDVDLPAGARAKTVIGKTGAIAFVCRYHPGMHGTFEVK